MGAGFAKSLLFSSVLSFSGLASAQSLFSSGFNIEKSEFFTEVQSLSHSQIAPLDQTINNLEGPAIQRGEISFTTNNISFGQKTYFRFRGFRAGISYALFSRKDYYLNYSPDTAELIYADQNNIELDGRRVYDVDLQSNSLEADGARVGFIGFYRDKLEYEIQVAWMDAYDMTYGRLWGDINSLDANAEGNLFLDYQYSSDVIFDREESGIKAKGKSLDLRVSWQVTPKLNIGLHTQDLYSEIHWKGQDRTVADANTDRVSVDDFGTVTARPLLQRKEDTFDLVQRLPSQLRLSESYEIVEGGKIKLQHYWYDSFLFNRVGYEQRMFSWVVAETFYDIDAEAWGLGISMPYFELMMITDSTDLEKAQTLGLVSRINYHF